MKKIIYLALGATAIFVASCKKDNFNQEKELVLSGTAAPDTLKGEVTVNTTVTKTTILKGFVYVKNGVTLTINPGVTIIGSAGGAIPDTFNFENNKGSLMIEKGGKLIANGTATQPIIWTSSKPVGTRAFGDWGGLVIYGKAPMHSRTGAATGFYEAFDFDPTDTRNTFGGTNALDNSGSITYNRFEFGGGVVFTANKEINGVTLCGVGSGTVMNHIEVLKSGDDGFEFFGGTVNLSHLLSFDSKDDQFDFDEGYQGKLQYIIGYNAGTADNSGSELIESDNDALSTNFTPVTNAFIANATLVGPTTAINTPTTLYYNGGAHIRRNTRLTLVNSIFAAQKHPFLFVTTPTTLPRVAAIPSLSDSIVISYNLIQADDLARAAVSHTAEGSPIPLSSVNNATLVSRLGSAQNANTVLTTFADFKLGAALEPLAGSPALTGGQNLAALGVPFFTGTTQRGAVRTTDIWTAGAWLSIASN